MYIKQNSKIIFGSWNREKDHNVYTPNNTGSGYENIAACLDGSWHALSEKTKQSFDVVLCCFPSGTDKIEKPECWDKLILIQEAGFGVLNTHWFYEKLLDINADGYLVHSNKLLSLFKSLNKPIYEFFPPYPFKKVQLFNKKQTNKSKICLNMSRLFSTESNVAGSIRLCQILPDFQFISYTSDCNNLKKIISKANVKNWEVKPELHWENYLYEVSDCGIFASLDNRYTWGRFQLDAVALNKVCVGAYSATQDLFYPKDFLVEPTDVEGVASLIKRYIGDTFSASDELIEKISHDNFIKSLNKIN